MNTQNPLISVILPTYNRADLLGESLQSVLDQTVEDFECIVIDDGSTDDTESMIQPYLKDKRIRFYRQENAGCGGARNTALQYIRGRYIAVQDSDDLWMADKLEHQLPLFDKSHRVGLVYGRIEFFDTDTGETIGEKHEGDHLQLTDVLQHKLPATQTLMFRREVLEDVNGFLSGWASCEDYVFSARVASSWELHGTNQLLARVRVHPGQVSRPSDRVRQAQRDAVDLLLQEFGEDPACRESLLECRRYYRWMHYRQLNDAARDSWRAGSRLDSLSLRLKAVRCDPARAIKSQLSPITGSKPKEYWGR